jgi:acyl carrier protein
MTLQDIYSIVVRAIHEVTGHEIVQAEQRFDKPLHEGGLDLDELDQIAVIMTIEGMLDIEIDDDTTFDTPLEIAKHIESLPKKPDIDVTEYTMPLRVNRNMGLASKE